MTAIAVYRRTVHASLARIWENVLDWEHLPWLHSSSFLGIELLRRDANSWRGRVTLPPAQHPREAVIDVQLERPQQRYWARTIEGSGAGTEILTTLTPVAERATDIAVEFLVPNVAPESVAPMGAAYTAVYTQLWNEDESMMLRRQALLDATGAAPEAQRAPVQLGPLNALRSRLPLVIDAAAVPVRLVEVDGELCAYTTICPHLGGPLDAGVLANGIVTCPWHGYRFDVRSGRNVDGRSLCLEPAPVVRIDDAGVVSLVWE